MWISAINPVAQMTVVGIKFIHFLGITKSELIPLSHGVNAANNLGLGLLGGALIVFFGVDCNGDSHMSKQLCYVATNIDTVFLSKSACTDLGIISKSFLTIGTYTPNLASLPKSDSINNESAKLKSCDCTAVAQTIVLTNFFRGEALVQHCLRD